jgi:hypothetical protein
MGVFLTALFHCLSGYSTQYTVFLTQCETCFGGMGEATQQTLQTIHNEFLEFEDLSKEVIGLRDLCEDLRSSVSPLPTFPTPCIPSRVNHLVLLTERRLHDSATMTSKRGRQKISCGGLGPR